MPGTERRYRKKALKPAIKLELASYLAAQFADSPGCLALLKKPWFKAVRGNHEEMAVDALEFGDRMLWVISGGDWFRGPGAERQEQIREALLGCQELPLIIETSHARSNACHRAC